MKSFKNPFSIFLIALIVLSIAGIIYILQFKEEPEVTKEPKQETKKAEPGKSITARKEKTKPLPEKGKQKTVIAKAEKMPLQREKIAIIIDDIGNDMKPVKELMNIDANLTFAIMPFCAHSREAAEIFHRAHRETLLHLPMEPVSYPNEKPGPGALFTDMNDEELLFQLEKNIAAVPYVSGVNNHMGSKLIADEGKLTVIFKKLKKKNLFFVDSRTSANSKAFTVAEKVGLPIASRKIFLDNSRDYNEIYNTLMNVTHNHASSLILIGHPYPETIRAISDASKVLREKGIEIVPVSEIIK